MTARLRDCETAKQMYSGVACRCGRSRARLRARSIDALMRVRMIFSPRKTEAYASSSSSVYAFCSKVKTVLCTPVEDLMFNQRESVCEREILILILIMVRMILCLLMLLMKN
jgi:hypothetical protein